MSPRDVMEQEEAEDERKQDMDAHEFAEPGDAERQAVIDEAVADQAAVDAEYQQEAEAEADAMTADEFAAVVLEQTQRRLKVSYPTSPQWEWERVRVTDGPKYTKVDIGPEHNMSGKYMIDNATGEIFGIKGYGRVHKGHTYGTLATAGDWYWGGYTGQPRSDFKPVDQALFDRTAPQWNCVRYPLDGMHYVTADGDCAWCGKSARAISDEYAAAERCCENCQS